MLDPRLVRGGEAALFDGEAALFGGKAALFGGEAALVRDIADVGVVCRILRAAALSLGLVQSRIKSLPNRVIFEIRISEKMGQLSFLRRGAALGATMVNLCATMLTMEEGSCMCVCARVPPVPVQ